MNANSGPMGYKSGPALRFNFFLVFAINYKQKRSFKFAMFFAMPTQFLAVIVINAFIMYLINAFVNAFH